MKRVNIYKGDPYEDDCLCYGFDEELTVDTMDMTEGEKKAALIKICVRKSLPSGLYWAGTGNIVAIDPVYFIKR